MVRLSRLLLLVIGLFLLFGVFPEQARSSDPDADAIAGALSHFGQRLDELGAFEEFAEPVPLTSTSASDVLGLDTLFGEALDLTGPFGSLDDLENAFPAGFTAEISNAGDLIDVHLTVEKSVSGAEFPLVFSDEVLDLEGGSFSADVSLAATFDFQLDKTLLGTDPGRAFYLVTDPNSPTIDVTVDTGDSAAIASFSSLLGFTEIAAAGTATVRLKIHTDFADPDGNGHITREEWTNTLLVDLVGMTYEDVPSANDVDISLEIDSDLVSEPSPPTSCTTTPPDCDGTLSLVIADLSANDPPATPTVDLGDQISKFANVSANEVLAGLGQFAIGLDASQVATDVTLPFLEGRFRDAFSPADEILTLVKQQTDALVLCGTANTVPPTGDPSAGGTIYCQAIAPEDPEPGTVTWSKGGVAAQQNASDDATVGVSPSKNAVFEGVPPEEVRDIQVFFSDPYYADGYVNDGCPQVGDYDDCDSNCDGDCADADEDVLCANATDDDACDTAEDHTANGGIGFVNDGCPADGPAETGTQCEDATDNDQESHTVVPRVRSAQQLLAELSEIATSAVLDYDETTLTLTYDIAIAAEPEVISTQLAFADRLRQATNLANLLPGEGASASFNVGGVDVNATFGVILVDDIEQITPGSQEDPSSAPDSDCDDEVDNDGDGLTDDEDPDCPRDDDRFFMGVNPGGSEFKVDDVTVFATVDLTGNIGFLGVTAVGSAAANTTNPSTPFEIVKANDGSVLTVDITPAPDGIPVEAFKILDAILLRELLADINENVERSVNLKMSAGLEVTGEGVTNGGSPLTGTVAIAWPDISTGEPTVTPDSAFSSTLQRFDIMPTVSGVHNGAEDANALTDTTRDFREAFGRTFSLGDVVPAQLINTTDGSSCSSFKITAADTLTCVLADGTEHELQGGTEASDNNWDVGDRYEIRGNPAALGIVILENLFDLTDQVGNLTTDGWSSSDTLPLVGVSAKDLVRPQFEAVLTAIADINTGASDADITCAPAPGAVIWCQATAKAGVLGPIASVTWAIAGGSCTDNCESPDTVGYEDIGPSDWAKFNVDDFESFAVTLTFKDASAETHVAIFPPPSSLAELELALESRLGLGPDALAFTLEDLQNPATGTSLKHLVTRLALDESGEREFALRMNLSPGLDSELVEEEGAGGPDGPVLTHESHVQLDIGIPLSGDVDPSSIAVLEDSEASLTDVSLNTTDIDTQAAIGGVSVRLGGEVVAQTGTHTLLTITGSHTSETESETTLTDGNTDFLAAGVMAGATIFNTSQENANCEVTSVEQHAVTCDGLSDDKSWEKGDTYELTGPSTTTLYDPSEDLDFTNLGIAVGDVVTHMPDTADAASCWITEVTENTIVCSDGLPGGAAWDEGDTYEVGAVSVAKFNADFDLSTGGSGTLSIEDFIAGLTASLTGPDPDNECGPGGTGDPSGDACARLSVAIEPNGGDPQYVGILGFQADLEAGTSSATVPDALSAAVSVEPLAWSLLTLALPELGKIVEDNLDGWIWGESLPLVGPDLAAGADIPADMASLSDALSGLSATAEAASGDSLETELEEAIASAIGTLPAELSVSGTDVTVECEGGCSGADLEAVKDVQISFVVGGNLSASDDVPEKGCVDGCGIATVEVPFDIGPPGLPISSDDNVESQVGWRLDVTFGLSRTDGPYLQVDTENELTLGAKVTLADVDGPCEEPKTDIPDSGLTFSGDRCLDGVLGLLPGSMYDGEGTGDDDSQSQLNLLTKLDLTKSGAPTGRLGFGDLLDGTTGHVVRVDAAANVDLSFTTGSASPDSGFPSLVGTVHLRYEGGVETELPRTNGALTQAEYKNVYLDPSHFFGEFVGPIVEEAQKYTKPFQPVINTLRAPIPVISDLSNAVGKGPVSLLVLLEAGSGNNLTLISRIADFITFVNNMPADKDTALIPLGANEEPGSFALKTTLLGKQHCGQTRMTADRKTTKRCTQASVSWGPSGPGVGKNFEKIDKSKVNAGSHSKGFDVTSKVSAGVALTNPGITFPFLDNSMEIYGMLLGEDATLVRLDFGTLKASAGLSWKFGPFMVGPVPVGINVGGSVDVSARFALGFDTRGLRFALTGDSFTGDALIDGIFIDDYDAAGNEVPEIKLSASIFAGASITIKIFEAGLNAGATFSLNLDLNDPNDDGKMRIEEINVWRSNPLCLFEVYGTLEFFLKLYFQIDFKLFTSKWEWEPYRTRPPIKLFELKCEPPQPVLAQVVVGENLRLNMGPYTSDRNIFEDVEKEKFIVRQLTEPNLGCAPVHDGDKACLVPQGGPATVCDAAPDDWVSGTWVSVTFQGIHQDCFVPSGGRIVADGGSEKDVILLEPGSVCQRTDNGGSEETCNPVEVPFNLNATIAGGAGNDRITTGLGYDVITGGDGDDVINARAGDDVIQGDDTEGGQGRDSIDGGTGNDIIDGGPDNDILNGGPGGDLVRGGAGNDSLAGGPGLPPESPAEDELKDGVDVLIGGPGDDTLDGAFRGDYLFGDDIQGYAGTDEALLADPSSIDKDVACAAENGSTGNDKLNGGDGAVADSLFGGGGHDDLISGEGDDLLCGNSGNDVLDGEEGNDDLNGGSGNDTLSGQAGNDSLDGGPDNDLLRGGEGPDDLIGGTGYDAVFGEDGHDIILGDTGTIESHGVDDHGEGAEGLVDAYTPDGAGQITCDQRVEVIDGKVDVNGDGEANESDDGLFEGFTVEDGEVDLNHDGDIDEYDSGILNDIVVLAGLLDVDDDGDTDADDDGMLNAVAVVGSDNADCLFGGDGIDVLFGGPGDDDIFGDAGTDYLRGNDHADLMHGGQDDDEMFGDAGDDTMFGDSGQDDMYGGDNNDTMRGGIGQDEMYGNDGADEMHGEAADDYMEGNGGDDEMYGDAGQDDLIGGTSQDGGGVPDGGDTMYGGPGHDVMTGDNASITRPGGAPNPDGSIVRSVQLFDLGCDDDDEAGNDIMSGDDGNDDMYGGGEGDTMHGNAGDDYLEGNCGDDEMYGDAGQDDLIGGTSQEEGGVPDGGDTMYGGSNGDDLPSDFDVMAGDNASIVRPVSDGEWITDDFSAEATGVVRRTVTLYDVGEVGAPAGPRTSGGDDMYGEGGFDIMYGQGGNDNEMRGGTGDDYMEGNDGDDKMYGDAGQDDLIGGTGRTTSDDDSTAMDGRLDGADTIYGGDGAGGVADNDYDVIMGDNATVDRPLDAGQWQTNSFNDAVMRIIRLYDVGEVGAPVGADTSGGDELRGEANDDTMYGQGGDDTMHGDDGDDYMEGNDGSDSMFGDAGNDDMIGGTGPTKSDDPSTAVDGRHDAGELMMSGGDGFDFMAGDNAVITRTLVNGAWQPNTFNGGIQHEPIILLDINSPHMGVVSGGDIMSGGNDDDVMYGQGNQDNDDDGDGKIDEDPADDVDNDEDGSTDEDTGADVMHGDAGDDYMEGNHGADFMFGDGDEDDMIGGSSVAGRHDAGDFMYGDTQTDGSTLPSDSHDVMLGDNGTIIRPLTDGAWTSIAYRNGAETRIQRVVAMLDTEPGDTSGSDLMRGNGGDDDMYGQFDDGVSSALPAIQGDLLCGDAGEDAMLGDQGLITNRSEDGGPRQRHIAPKMPFIEDDIFVAGSLTRIVELTEIEVGGNDVMLGGSEGDWMHGGAGDDLMNGNSGEDRLFGDDGNDAVWGGTEHDHLYGGHGDDALDVQPRAGIPGFEDDLPEWFVVAPASDAFQGIDYIYGGWGQDAMQADQGDAGPVSGDRLMDWAGVYNAYYVCPAAFGERIITRALAPSLIVFIQDLAEGDGALNPGSKGSSGFNEVAMVFSKDVKDNSNPPHPDTPGHFTCVE
jgi:Ca2+-binding RTX toxin-like protein